MPKTAGVSFRATLEEHFGGDFQHDYADYPLACSPAQRHRMVEEASARLLAVDLASVNCIHGHFLPAKYLALAEARECHFVTWLREPVSRLVSHYYYWLRAYDSDSPLVTSLHRRVVEENWTLEAFCLAPELQNVYSAFLWGLPVENLDFIGITEHYEEDLQVFAQRFFGENVTPRKMNRRDDAPEQGSGHPEMSADLRAQVECFHAEDVALYQRAVAARQGSYTLR